MNIRTIITDIEIYRMAALYCLRVNLQGIRGVSFRLATAGLVLAVCFICGWFILHKKQINDPSVFAWNYDPIPKLESSIQSYKANWVENEAATSWINQQDILNDLKNKIENISEE